MKVPFLDLKSQYQGIKNEIDDAIRKVVECCAFSGGIFVEKFEEEFAEFCNTKNAVGVGSGTDALLIALLASDVGENDEVITVPNTFFATIEAICHCGATPVLVDVNEKTYNMDTSLIEKSITERTRAIVPVHLFGQMADMDEIMKIAEKHGLLVIEDACQAHGAEYHGKMAGGIGHAGCFSFYPGKNLGAYGEAGAVVTDNDEMARKMKMLRDHGQKAKYRHDMMGLNSRMDGIQAAILSVKLKHLAKWNDKRKQIARQYNLAFEKMDGIVVPYEKEYCKHIYHVYSIQSDNRDHLSTVLRKNNIETGIHYPNTVHHQDAFKAVFKSNGALKTAEAIAKKLISLPIYPEMSSGQIGHVVAVVSGEMGEWLIEKTG
jgi:dTDP-4-amino-4,6-dideoxygalactose transaminase